MAVFAGGLALRGVVALPAGGGGPRRSSTPLSTVIDRSLCASAAGV